jgi:hypothetical protein
MYIYIYIYIYIYRERERERERERAAAGMICSANPVLTGDFCVVQKEEFSIACYM